MHTKNILNLFEELLYIIYLLYIVRDMCAKYGRSRMNDVHTICLADFAGLPVKIVWPTTFFSKKKANFVRLLHWPPAGQHWESAHE